MTDFFQSFPIAGQDLSTPRGRQVLQDALDALYDLIQRMQTASALDLRGKFTVRSGRGDAPLDGDSGAGLEIEAVDQVIADAAGTGKTMLTGFDLKVIVARALEELVEEDRVVTTRVRITERKDCDGRLELLDCDKTTRCSLGTDGAVRMADVGGASMAAGDPGYIADGDAPYFVGADGTKVAIRTGPEPGLSDMILTPYHLGSTIVGFGEAPGALTSTGATSFSQSGDSTRSFLAAVLDATGLANFAQVLTRNIQIPTNFVAWDTGNALVLYHRVGWTGVATSGVARVQMTIEDTAGNVDTVLRDVTYPTDDGSTWQTIALDASVMPTARPFYVQVKVSIATAGAAGTADIDIGDLRFNWH